MKARKTIQDVLIEMCIIKFTQDCGVSGDENYQKVFGIPPKVMLIHVGPATRVGTHDYWKMGLVGVDAFLYTSGTLIRTSRMRRYSTEESGMYYKEAYAEAGYDGEGRAFVMTSYGKRYARCYEYDVVITAETINLGNERLMWVS